MAGCVGTIVHVNFAVDPLVAKRAHAAVTGHLIDTYAAVKTGFLGTVIDVRLAVLPYEALWAGAGVPCDLIHTHAAVET